MNYLIQDSVEVKNLDLQGRSLLFRVSGRDRTGIVAYVTGVLEAQNLYVESISFNLVLPSQDHYEMEVLAKGQPSDLNEVFDRIKANHFLESMTSTEQVHIYWPMAYMFHVALSTPDREGLIAKISEIVGRSREVSTPYKTGSFVHLVGMTHNSGGPEGGTAYFSVRANIASQAMAVQQQIEADLFDWAREQGIEGDLWTRDLNPA